MSKAYVFIPNSTTYRRTSHKRRIRRVGRHLVAHVYGLVYRVRKMSRWQLPVGYYGVGYEAVLDQAG